MYRDRALHRLFSAQHSLITREQALDRGLPSHVIQYRVASGRWERIHDGVYRLAGSVATTAQEVMAATLAAGPGAAASHRAAAALRGWPIEGRWIEITVPERRR